MAFPFRRALWALDPERAHALTLTALAAWGKAGAPFAPPVDYPRLATTVAGLRFANPLAVAAGLDKDARAVAGLFALGVGAVEVGTLTPLPQPGNPRPRMFRLAEEEGVINRLGFNNGGLPAALARLPARRARRLASLRTGVLGVNVGANKDAADRVADYVTSITAAASRADYLTINISSPNTPGLRDLQHGQALHDLLAACTAARGRTPLFLKVAPDLEMAQVDDIARAAIDARLDALIVGNTTVSRPPLRGVHAGESGGLSGAPLAPLAMTRLRDFRDATGGGIALIAAGGIGSGAEAYARIRAGAGLVQLYTALVYGGPALPARMARELDGLLARDGFASVDEAVGVKG